MSSILTIIKKEFLDTLRDRRTLITMIVLPLVLFPAIFGISISVQKSLAEKAREKELNVGLIVDGKPMRAIHNLRFRRAFLWLRARHSESG